MIVLVTGGRTYCDVAAIFDCLVHLNSEHEHLIVVHGDAPGADNTASKVCKEVGIDQVKIPANWTKYDRAAGPIRNTLMIDLLNVDLVLAFPGDVGTKNMCSQASKREIPIIYSSDLLEIIREG